MRYSRTRWVIAAVAVLALAAVGCDGSPAEDSPTGDEVDADTSGSEPSDEETTATGPAGSLRLSGWVEEHPARVALSLRGVEVDAAGHLLLDVEAVNRGSVVSVAEFGVRVRDDLGNRYAFQRPEDNGGLRFTVDERLTGTLAFEGPIDPDARYLEVGFNQSGDGSVSAAEDGISQYPAFLFEQVPLPGVGLEDEAVRGPSSELMEEQVVEVGQVGEVAYLDGLEVTLQRYVVGTGVIRVELEAVNGTGRAVQLAAGSPRLDDGRDSHIVYEANESDDRAERVIEMGPGDEATVTISFRGTIASDAESLQLRLNGHTRGEESATKPYMEFNDLPLPGEEPA